MRAKHIPVLIAESSNVTQSSDSRPSFSRGWGLLGLTLGHGVSNKSRLRLAEMNAKPATHARIDRPERKKSSVWTSWIASVSSQSPAQRSGSRTIVSLIQASVGGTHGLWRNKIQSSEIIHGRSPLGCPCGTAALGSLLGWFYVQSNRESREVYERLWPRGVVPKRPEIRFCKGHQRVANWYEVVCL